MSKAYEFYSVLKENSTKPNIEKGSKRQTAKPPFEATSYMTLYAASDKNDAADKDDCQIILNRDVDMWDCSKIGGSSGCYEFIGKREAFEGNRCTMGVRFLPCCCTYCSEYMYEEIGNDIVDGCNVDCDQDDARREDGDADENGDVDFHVEPNDVQCSNINLVGQLTFHEVKLLDKVVVPAVLSEPLMAYNGKVLKAFIKIHKIKGKHSNKNDMCNLIRSYYAQLT